MTDAQAGGVGGVDAVAPLLAPQLDALFWRPTRLGVDSAWYGHVPFAHWIVAAARPRLLVELGTHAGVSYAAFCESVQRSRFDTACIAVDTWRGDEHAGFYGEDVFADLQTFHDARYGSFSRLLRSDFDGALAYVDAGSVDLLHIDGRHTYADVRHDFDSWSPKLSDRAVVLFHDTTVRERDFGVWRLWAELAPRFAHFEFLHAYGLGVLCVGAHAPPPVRALCELGQGGAVAEIRERFAMLGDRWVMERAQRRLEQAIQGERVHAAETQGKFQQLLKYTQELEAARNAPPAREELRGALARAVAAENERRLAEARASQAETDAAVIAAEYETLVGSRAWRLAERLRAGRVLLRGGIRPTVASLRSRRPAARPSPATTAAPAAPRVLFAAGEPGTPGCIYRCERQVETAAACGWQARWKPAAEIAADDLRETDLVVLWRVTWSAHIEGVIEHTHMFGGRVALDLDDLMIRLDIARVTYIDAIRSINWSEQHVRGMFSAVMQVLDRVDFCIATTAELAAEMRRWQKAAYVLPNGFDAATWRRGRAAARRRLAAPPEATVRIGYAGGSRTHQRDFSAAAPALAAVLRARPQVRLVLFRSDIDGEPLLAPDEFPDLVALSDQVEWRDTVPLAALPEELARFDINIAPLQTGNPFVEAKSELKYFEAALAGVPTVASPTGPYQRAIRDGETGFLAADDAAWEQALLALIDDAALRDRVARSAAAEVLWRFGPEGRAHVMRRFLSQQRGGPRPHGEALGAAFALNAAEARLPPRAMAPVQPTETLFQQDRLGEAAVTVVIASYNYADFIAQALASVELQTLPLLDLVIVDDASSDPATVTQILDWTHAHAARFNRLVVLRHRQNAGLGATRNTGFAWAETPYVLPLDADNRLRAECAARLLAVIEASDGAAYAYPQLQHFGADDRITGGKRYEPQRLVGGNYIDAMALVARWAWSAASGYYVQRDAMGWEDFALWCRMAELGLWGVAVDEVLAEYRVHEGSMVNAITETLDNKRAMLAFVEARHPWLEILSRDPHARE